MKFVQKNLGLTSENSSGGGTDGFLKEMLYMFLAYGAMIASVVIGGLVLVALVAWFSSI